MPPQRRTIPFVSSATPAAGGVLPPVSGAPVSEAISSERRIPLVSGTLPPVSRVPPITIVRFWGLMPPRRWGETRMPITRRREIAPKKIGLFRALGELLTPGLLPVRLISGVAGPVREQAERESGLESSLRERLLENRMRYEAGEISEREYREREEEIRRELERIAEIGE